MNLFRSSDTNRIGWIRGHLISSHPPWPAASVGNLRAAGCQIEDLKQRLGGLPAPAEARDIWGDIWYQEAHNSTAIEGNTLVLKEVEALLAEGRAVGDKQLRDYLEVQGYAAAAQWVYGQAWKASGARADCSQRPNSVMFTG